MEPVHNVPLQFTWLDGLCPQVRPPPVVLVPLAARFPPVQMLYRRKPKAVLLVSIECTNSQMQGFIYT